MADVQIDEKLFSERLSHFYAGWKADKRSGDQIFGGVGSILVIMGKAAETQSYSKSSAVHVRLRSASQITSEIKLGARLMLTFVIFQFWLLGYEFPATIFLFTAGAMYVVTTAKKGISS
jgi:nucleosome binding factor SPN SPT16 subunit